MTSPAEHYQDRLERRQGVRARLAALEARIGGARLAIAAFWLALAWTCLQRGLTAAWLWIPTAAFAAAVLWHQRIRERLTQAERAARWFQRALDRLHGGPQAVGADGGRFSDAHHVYGADLDLFGKNSLFERLCTARTPLGEETLAAWLLAPADVAAIRGRHAAVAELRTRHDLREDLLTISGPERMAFDAKRLLQWAVAPNDLARSWLRATSWVLIVAAAAAGVFWAIRDIAFPFLAVLGAEAAVTRAAQSRVRTAVTGVEHAYEDLRLMAALIARIEAEPFDAPHLRTAQHDLSSHSLTASLALRRLATIVNVVESRRNPFLAPLLLPTMHAVLSSLAAEDWRRRHGAVIPHWLRALGEIEALASIASYSFERPQDPLPEFVAGPAAFRATGLGHPLIAAGTRVRNDVQLDEPVRILLVSGSNMSGKSTLLRAVGMNTVLAMAGAPVCATRLELTPLQVGASIRVNDSLFEGTSRFYAEITRLKQLFEPSSLPLLFLLDELLQGTNSADRRAGAQGVLGALLKRGAIGLVSTHDLALADAALLEHGALRNVHFQEELANGRLSFDFTLRDGVVTKSNGIELMRAIGLDV